MDNAQLVLTGTPQVAANHGIAYFTGRDSRVFYWIRRPGDAPDANSSHGEISPMAEETFVTVPRGFHLYLAGEGICHVETSEVDMQIETDDVAESAMTGDHTQLVTGTAGVEDFVAIWDAEGNLVDSLIDHNDIILGVTGANGNVVMWNAEGEVVDANIAVSDVILGTVGTDNNLVAWNQDGEVDDSGIAISDVILGTAGNENELVIWDAAGGAVTSDVLLSEVLVSSNLGTSVQGFDEATMKSDEAVIISASHQYDITDGGTQTTGTYAPDTSSTDVFHIVNGGAFALGVPAPSENDVCRETKILITNNASAGAIDTSAFTQVIGDTFTTTDGDEFLCTITVIDVGGIDKSVLGVTALQ